MNHLPHGQGTPVLSSVSSSNVTKYIQQMFGSISLLAILPTFVGAEDLPDEPAVL